MATEAETDVSKFIFIKTFDEAEEYPLSDSLPFLTVLVGAYLLFVKIIGPEFMKNREPYKLKNTILVYNAVQVVLSALFCYYLGGCLVKSGLFPKKCCQDDPELRKPMLWAVYFYFVGKITELLDTVFFVLRKKYNQVSFLHVYHHASVVLGTWMMFKYSLNMTVVYAGFINSLVHVVMYFYYFMAALGPQYQKYLTWKKHITTFQLVQFVSMFSHQIVMLLVSDCSHSVLGIAYVLYSTVLFYVLFSNFYNQSYKKPAKKNQNGTTEKTQNGIAEKTQNGISEKTQNGINSKGSHNGVSVANGHKTKAQ